MQPQAPPQEQVLLQSPAQQTRAGLVRHAPSQTTTFPWQGSSNSQHQGAACQTVPHAFVEPLAVSTSFDTLDRSHDGVLTREELAVGVDLRRTIEIPQEHRQESLFAQRPAQRQSLGIPGRVRAQEIRPFGGASCSAAVHPGPASHASRAMPMPASVSVTSVAPRDITSLGVRTLDPARVQQVASAAASAASAAAAAAQAASVSLQQNHRRHSTGPQL